MERRIGNDEIGIFKNTFAENDTLLKSVRKIFLQLPMEDAEKSYVSALFKDSEPLLAATRKLFLPEINGEAPLGQHVDLFMTFPVEGNTPETVWLGASAREKLISFIEEGLADLVAPKTSDKYSTFKPVSDPVENFIFLTARNTYISHVEQRLIEIKVLAGKKEETVDQTLERLNKDSAR